MLDLQFIIANPDVVKAAITNKGVRGITPADVDTIISLASSVKSQTTEVQQIRSERNLNAEKIKSAKTPEEKAIIIDEGKSLKDRISALEEKLNVDEQELLRLLSFVPGIPSKDTPIGKDESGNTVHHDWGKKSEFDFEPKNHVELLTNLGLIDLDRGAKVAGFRGYFLKGDAAMLEWAVIMFAIEKLRSKGFELTIPPILVKEYALFGAAQFPWSPPTDTYRIQKGNVDETGKEVSDQIFLAATAEQPLMAMYANEVVDLSKPMKLAGLSPCYRQEIGSYSKDVKGIYRVHEFMKVEQVVIMEPDDEKAEAMHTEILTNAEEILQDLGIHYRVLSMCTGDMGEPQYKKYDIESWMPGKGSYGETHSASNMRDFQCRRNNIKMVNKDGEKVFAYSLNNTAIALPRFLIALVEQYQTKEGHIRVPEALQKYMGKKIIS